MNKKNLTFDFGFGHLDIWMILPTFAAIYDPKEKSFEMGLFFLKYCLTLKIK
jgi:hypothetical protein